MILAFDCATQTGWCAGDGDGKPVLGTVNMPSGVEPGPFLDFWRRWLEQCLDDVKPTVVIFEAPVLPRETQIATVRKLCGLANEIEVATYRRKIEVTETTTSHVKKVLTGSGSSPKPDMMRCARQCGLEPRNFDEADAFGVWLCAVHHYARQHQPKWDKLLYSGKGLL